ncbi:hypothetical protein ACU635_13345 [[Actinomadura] parvosata]|uniref:hypothetical protein n=1 Tax=[Actinomadura] parvosata TaxID=1955412 RepID=UPI00406BF42C
MNTREIVRGYHDARYRGDLAGAVALVSEESFSFRSPFIASTDPAGHLAGLEGFLRVVTEIEMISELYGESEATLVYDVHTATPAGVQRTAEHFRLRDGKIDTIMLIFDAAPWQPMAAAIR